MPAKKRLLVGVAAALAGSAALDLGARRLIARSEPLEPDDLAPGEPAFWLRGTRVHYLEAGSGFPVVLVHGFGASTFSFRLLAPALAQRYRVIAVDLPGFGASGREAGFPFSQSGWAAFLAEFLDRLDVERAVLLGHSIGGAIVERLAIARPSLAAGLVLVSAVSAAEPPRLPPLVLPPLVRLAQAALLLAPALQRRIARSTVYDPSFLQDEQLEGYLRPQRVRGSAKAYLRSLRDSGADTPIDVSRISAPTLLVWGASDRVVRPSVGERLHAAIPGSRLELVARAGHLPLEERPDVCNPLVLGFIDRIAQAEAGTQRVLRTDVAAAPVTPAASRGVVPAATEVRDLPGSAADSGTQP